jgi:hypothetical protein
MDSDRIFIERLTSDGEENKLANMNVNQMMALKKRIQKMKKDYLKFDNYAFQDLEEEYAYKQMLNYLDNYYPINDVSDFVKDKNLNLRKPIHNKFNAILINNHKIYIKDDKYEFWMKAIDDLMGKQAYNHKEYMMQKVICECGAESIRSNLSRHKSSVLHFKKLKLYEHKIDDSKIDYSLI